MIDMPQLVGEVGDLPPIQIRSGLGLPAVRQMPRRLTNDEQQVLVTCPIERISEQRFERAVGKRLPYQQDRLFHVPRTLDGVEGHQKTST